MYKYNEQVSRRIGETRSFYDYLKTKKSQANMAYTMPRSFNYQNKGK